MNKIKKHDSKQILFSVKVIDDLTGEKLFEIKNASLVKLKHKMDEFDSQITKLVMEKFR